VTSLSGPSQAEEQSANLLSDPVASELALAFSPSISDQIANEPANELSFTLTVQVGDPSSPGQQPVNLAGDDASSYADGLAQMMSDENATAPSEQIAWEERDRFFAEQALATEQVAMNDQGEDLPDDTSHVLGWYPDFA
jgi:hypothetical protein